MPIAGPDIPREACLADITARVIDRQCLPRLSSGKCDARWTSRSTWLSRVRVLHIVDRASDQMSFTMALP
jgi:hypothetical protein